MGPRPPICQNSHSLTATRSRGVSPPKRPVLSARYWRIAPDFEHRNRPAVGSVGIDDRRHAVVGRDGEKSRLELLACADVDAAHRIRQAALFEHDGDLPPVRSRPVIELDRTWRTGPCDARFAMRRARSMNDTNDTAKRRCVRLRQPLRLGKTAERLSSDHRPPNDRRSACFRRRSGYGDSQNRITADQAWLVRLSQARSAGPRMRETIRFAASPRMMEAIARPPSCARPS